MQCIIDLFLIMNTTVFISIDYGMILLVWLKKLYAPILTIALSANAAAALDKATAAVLTVSQMRDSNMVMKS